MRGRDCAIEDCVEVGPIYSADKRELIHDDLCRVAVYKQASFQQVKQLILDSKYYAKRLPASEIYPISQANPFPGTTGFMLVLGLVGIPGSYSCHLSFSSSTSR